MQQSEFLKSCSHWNDHLPLLWLALEETKDSKLPICEFGAGDGSTPYLRQYCLDNNREFVSYDFNKEWAEKTGSIHIPDWDVADIYKEYSVVLVDESPGEHRHETLSILKDKALILVVHDSETPATGYMLNKIWYLFKYRVNLNKDMGGAEASAVSNHIDVAKWDGQELAGFKITK